MNPSDFARIQAQLVRCQEVLDAARQEGWTLELVRAFDEATRTLHERAIIQKATYANLAINTEEGEQPTTEEENNGTDAPVQVDSDDPPANRLLTPEELGKAASQPDAQVDLLSSIGELTLAEKLALQPLANVADGLSIVDRAQFTSTLFSGEEAVFSNLLTKLARASTQEEALALFEEAMCPREDSEDLEALKEAFVKRILRTFVS